VRAYLSDELSQFERISDRFAELPVAAIAAIILESGYEIKPSSPVKPKFSPISNSVRIVPGVFSKDIIL